MPDPASRLTFRQVLGLEDPTAAADPTASYIGPREPPPEPPPLTGWRRSGDEALNALVGTVKGVTGLGDQGPAGPTWTNGAALAAAALPLAGVLKGAKQLRLRGLVPDTFALDDASRVARAPSQGYTPLSQPFYHETWAAHEAPLLQYGFGTSPVRSGSSGETLLPPGVFLKPTDQSIRLHRTPYGSPLGGEVQMPLVHRAQNIKEFADRAELEQFLRQDPQFVVDHDRYLGEVRRQRQDLQDLYNHHNQLYQAATTWNAPAVEQAAHEALTALQEAQALALQPYAQQARQASADVFKRLGHEGLRVVRDAGGGGRFVDTTLIFDPSQVRSTRAAFDPRALSSKKLLASLLLGVAGAGEGVRRALGSDAEEHSAVGAPPPVLGPTRPRQ